MFVQLKTVDIEKDHVEQYIETWKNRTSTIEGMIGKRILRDAKTKSAIQTIIIEIMWESEKAFKNWRTHPDHIAAHKNASKRPEWIKRVESKGYHQC